MTTMTTRGRVMRICWIWCTLSAGFSSSVTKGAFQGTFHPHRPMQTTFVSLPVRSLWLRRQKRLPTTLETRVQSLGQEGPLEKEMATHSSVLAWKIPWTEEPGRLQSMGS